MAAAELENDPIYQANRKRALARAAERSAMLAQDEGPMLQEIYEAGLEIESVWDLVNTGERYPEAVPVLLKHLEVKHHPWTKKGIVRALICPESQGIATEVLVRQFLLEKDGESELKWLLGSAIAESATPENVSILVELVRDKKHGKGREFLTDGLIHLPSEEAKTLLTELLEDPITQDTARKVLKKLDNSR